MTCNDIANKITRVSKDSQQNHSDAVTNEDNQEIPNEKSPEKRQKIIDEIRLI